MPRLMRRARIHTQHFDFHRVSGIYHLARMLDALGPAHFGNVDQSFNAVLELHKRAVVGHARDLSIHAAADREPFFDTGPRIGQQLFVTQRDALAFTIKLKDLDLNVIANLNNSFGFCRRPHDMSVTCSKPSTPPRSTNAP